MGKQKKAKHGLVKYPFAELKKIGDHFFLDDIKKQYSIHSCLKNYNKKHLPKIKIATFREGKQLKVERIK